MKKTGSRKYPADRIAMLSVLALSANQLGYPAIVSAEELSYEGTTQMPTEDYSLDIDTFAVELKVEEVYAEAGNTLSAGDKILKLTDDSYQDALDYYEAAVIRADNTLTDTQLEYDQGILDAKYEYETAETKADQAEFIKEYQTEELSDTIADHEDTADDLADKISEVESEIASGSYSSASSSGGASGGSAAGSAAGASQGTDEKNAADASGDSFTDQENSSDKTKTDQNASGENSSGDQNTSENQENNGGEAVINPEENTSGGENSSDQNTDNNGTGAGTEQEISDLKSRIETSTEKYNEILNQLEALVNTGSGETEDGTQNSTESSTESSTGENTETGTADSTEDFSDSTSETDTGSLTQELQNSIDGDTTIKGHMENVQKMVKNVPDSVTAAASLAGIEYEQYITLLDECITQMQSNLDAQQKVLAALNAAENGSSTDTGSGSESGNETDSGKTAGNEGGIDAETMKSLLTQLEEANTERNSLYSQLLTVMETQLKDTSAELSQLKEQAGTNENTNTDNSGNNGTGGTGTAENTNTAENTGENGTSANTGSTENAGLPSNGTFPGGTGTNGTNTNGTDANGTGTAGTDTNAAGANAAGMNMSGFSMPSGGSAAAGAAGGTASGTGTSGTTVTGTTSGSMTMEDLNLTEEDISLFGDTYDLTQIKSLLDQDPMDSDSAESLLKQLEEAADTVDTQYSELTRNQKATELKIQYTYDTSVLDGKLAKITYEQTLQDWEDTLQEAKDNKADLEEKKELLESMSDGVLTSENGGTVAAVNYEADDTLNAMTPVLSYYDTSVVTVTISVPQDEIAQLKVGDSVDVTLSGMQNMTGTVSEKSLEASDGTSRTEVDYEVKISLDNSGGFLSSGMSAEISLDTEKVSEEGQTDTSDSAVQDEAAENTSEEETTVSDTAEESQETTDSGEEKTETVTESETAEETESAAEEAGNE